MVFKIVKLTDITKPKQWKNLPSSELTDEGYDVYGANGIIGKYTEYNHEFPTLAITCRGATCGNLHITKPKSYINSNAMALDNLSNDVNIKYLYYALFNRGLKDVITGSAQPQITREGLSKIKIPLPSLKEQIHISEILTNAENLITHRKESIVLLDELLKSSFLEMFGDPVKNDKGWNIDKIGNKCKVTKLAGYEYSKHIKYKEEGDIVVVKGMNVKNGRLKLDNNISYIDKTVSDFLVRSKLYEGDVVMTYIGINIGDVAIIEENEKYHLAPNVSKITPLSFKVINPYYLLHYLMYNRWLFVRGTTDTAKPALNMGEIRDIKIIIPNIEIQLQFEKIAKKIELLKTYYKSSLIELENMYGVLSQKAFKGELNIK
jgi:Restriction endonuclease S subunits